MDFIDETQNIDDPDIIIKEINNGDKILLETSKGFKTIDFKDFIIGPDNVTFFDRISADSLTFADISAVSGIALDNQSLITALTSVTGDIIDLSNRYNGLDQKLNEIISNVTNLSSIDTVTNADTDFKLRLDQSILDNYTSYVWFDKVEIGNSLVTSGKLFNKTDDGSGGNQFKYIAPVACNMLIGGQISVSLANKSITLNLLKNGSTISTISINGTSTGGNFIQSFNTFTNLNAGDIIELGISVPLGGRGYARVLGVKQTFIWGTRT